MKHVVIIGAGGHGREVAEIVRHQSQSAIAPALLGFIVDSEYVTDASDSSAKILGDWNWFRTTDCGNVAVICAVGDPVVRKELVEKAQSLGLVFTNAISPSAHIFPDAKFGNGVMVFPHAVISSNATLSDHTIVNAGATVSHDANLGRYGTIGPGVHLAGNVSVGEGCYVGIGASVIQRVSIGEWSTIGAGAAVTTDIPSRVLAAGVPAKVIKTS